MTGVALLAIGALLLCAAAVLELRAVRRLRFDSYVRGYQDGLVAHANRDAIIDADDEEIERRLQAIIDARRDG